MAGSGIALLTQSNGSVAISAASNAPGSTFSVATTGSYTTAAGTLFTDPTLQFNVSPGEKWTAHWLVPLSFNFGFNDGFGIIHDNVSMSGPTGSIVRWGYSLPTLDGGSQLNNGDINSNNSSNGHGGLMTLFASVENPLTGSSGNVSIALGQSNVGTVTVNWPAILTAVRIA